MSNGISYWKCSPELYNKYLATGRIIETDFYLVEDKANNIQELYLGTILLSSADESIHKIKELCEKLKPIAFSGLIEDLNMNWDTMLIFDGGDADVVLATLDETILL